jgi:predicted acylesterase/phospholipase RssA
MVHANESLAPKKIQLAIQGGGAKLILLMAALEALEGLRNQQKLSVTRLAGTSAGAIAGCLFAAGVPMGEAKAKFVNEFNEVGQFFPPASYWHCFWRFYRHRPLWNAEPLRRFLRDLFKSKSMATFGDIRTKTGTEVIIVASNLGTSKKVVYKGDEQDIVQSLLDSCAIPYCFRVWNRSDNPVIVDGGVCENLPSEELEQGEAEYGPVTAISFPHPSSKSPTNFAEFSAALLNTAIDHSVSRVKLRLGEDKVFSITSRADIGTFDFESAMDFAESDTYDHVREKSEAFFMRFVTPKEANTVVGDPWRVQNIAIMEKLGLLYRRQHADSKVSYLHCRFVVQANCLVEDSNDKWSKFGDLVRYSLVHRTLSEPIFCQRFSLLQTDHPTSLSNMEFSVLDWDNNPIDTTSLPVRDPRFPDKRALLLFFLPPLPPNSGPYTIEFTDEVNGFMDPLKGGKDELVVDPNRAEGKIGRIDWVLHVPVQFEKARLANKPGEKFGHRMMPDELHGRYPSPKGFRTVGWTAEDQEPRKIGVDIFMT